MSLGEILFLASPLIPIALAFWCKSKPIRSIILFCGLMSLVGLLIHFWTVGDGDGLSAPTLWIPMVYVYVVPVVVLVALVFEIFGRIINEISGKNER